MMDMLIAFVLLLLFALFVYWIGYSDGKLRQREKRVLRDMGRLTRRANR